MKEHRVRSILVIDYDLLKGIISIGDLVGEMMKNQTNQISFLETCMKDYGPDAKGNFHFSFLG